MTPTRDPLFVLLPHRNAAFPEVCRKWAGNVRMNCWGKWQKNEIFEKIWDPSMIWWRLSGQRAKYSVVKCYRQTSFWEKRGR